MAVPSTWIACIKILLILSGLVSISMLIKFSVPLVIQFILYQVPIIWSCIMSLLRPPYLYLVVNGIIIIIAVTSRYNKKAEDMGEPEPLVARPNHVVVYDEVVLPEVASPEVVKSVVVVNGAEDQEFVVSRSTRTPPERSKSFERLPEFVFSKPPEKPLVFTRVVRAPISSPQGDRPLKLAKPKQNETLENTWKMITKARPIPLLKKDDMWENQDHPLNPVVPSNPMVKKFATFRERTNYDPTANSSPSPVRHERSLSEDELNRRVEAFIKKVNDEMRLQRQESLNQYMDMINRDTR